MPDATNTLDPEKAQRWFKRIRSLKAEQASERGEMMSRHRNDLKDLYDEAKGEGVPSRALKKIVRESELKDTIAGLYEDMESDLRDQVDLLKASLGDLAGTGLGEAAVRNLETRAQEKSQALESLIDDEGRDLRPRFAQEGEQGDAGDPRGVSRLRRGLRKLPDAADAESAA